jgi:hypothetical protein
MHPPKLEATMARLRAFEPAQVKGSRKVPPGGSINAPSKEAIGEFTRLAAAGADELIRAGCGGELGRRATAFDTLTEVGSPLDNARASAHAAVTSLRARLDIPDRSAKPLSPPRRELRVGPKSLEVVWVKVYPNFLEKVEARWADCQHVRWNLGLTLEDVDALLREDLPPDDRQVLERWHQALWEVHTRVNQEHLLGSYLLAECQKALDPAWSTPQRYREVVELLLKAPDYHIKAIKDAAVDLFLTASQPAGPTPPVRDMATSRFHPPNEPHGAEFKFGPIAGNLKSLARMVCPQYHQSKDPRALERLDAAGEIWVEKVTGQLYKVYFKDQAIYAAVHALELRGKPQQ